MPATQPLLDALNRLLDRTDSFLARGSAGPHRAELERAIILADPLLAHPLLDERSEQLGEMLRQDMRETLAVLKAEVSAPNLPRLRETCRQLVGLLLISR